LYLVHIFRQSPMMAIAIGMCLGTILWCLFLTHRHQSRIDRFLSAVIGFITIYQALRTVKDSGVSLLPGFHNLDGFVDLMISSMCLLAALVLKLSYLDHTSTRVRLRLSEANEKTMELSRVAPPPPLEIANSAIEASPLAMFAVDTNGVVNYWNAAAEKLFGWKKDEVIGHRPPFALKASQGPDSSPSFRDRSGRPIEAITWSATMKHATGSVRGTLTIVADNPALLEAGLTPHLTAAK
jgi:PAS domain S-box-containing protein